jgi:hypothetical protein
MLRAIGEIGLDAALFGIGAAANRHGFQDRRIISYGPTLGKSALFFEEAVKINEPPMEPDGRRIELANVLPGHRPEIGPTCEIANGETASRLRSLPPSVVHRNPGERLGALQQRR